MKTELFEIIKKNITDGNTSFDFTYKDGFYHITTDKVYNAIYIYAKYYYSEKQAIQGVIGGSHLTIDESNLIAVYANEMFYIVNSYFFKIGNNEELPQNVIEKETVYEMKKDLFRKAFNNIYKKTTAVTITDENKIKQYKYSARRYLINNISIEDKIKEYADNLFIITDFDIFADICSYRSIEKVFNEILKRNENNISAFKAMNVFIEEEINNGTAAEQWELEMTNAIAEIKDTAKTLNVTFELNGVKQTIKITPNNLLYAIEGCNNNYYFSDYEFCNSADGARMLEKLDAKRPTHSDKKPLTSKDIVEITYRKNIIFER